jgi:hypothetical protein
MQRLQNEVSFRAAELSVAVVKPHADDDVSVRFSLRPLRILAVPLALKSFLVLARKNADSIIKSVIPSGAAFQAKRGISVSAVVERQPIHYRPESSQLTTDNRHRRARS